MILIMIGNNDDAVDDGCMQKTYRLQCKSQYKVIATSPSPFSSSHRSLDKMHSV